MARSEIGRTGARFGAPRSRHAPDPEQPHGRETGPPSGPATGPGPAGPGATGPGTAEGGAAGTAADGEDLVGVTGARFGGHSTRRTRTSRRRRAAERAAAGERAAARAAAAGPAPAGPAGPRGREGGSDGGSDTAPLPVVAGAPPETVPAFAPVRPYVMTGGRTRVRAELRLETLVSARPGPAPAQAESVERAAVLRLCAQTRSVSEVAALASVPLGVARVLIDDLAVEGRLVVHGVSSAEDGPSMALLDRVLSGLRRL
ncbi:DUF742 domain-containing protein [Pseudonocardia spirodelae]|uniref:DUF742 domain-containing protein n=1 Tax=Pseudonocardia spirodelae TaxID=3133431 RepID=A0ABU8T875_9PSEU